MDINQNNIFGTNNLQINNFDKPARIIDDKLRNFLLDNLPKSKKVVIGSLAGNNEAYNFGKEIKKYLEKSGYSAIEDSLGREIYLTPVKGIEIDPNNKDFSHIKVGENI